MFYDYCMQRCNIFLSACGEHFFIMQVNICRRVVHPLASCSWSLEAVQWDAFFFFLLLSLRSLCFISGPWSLSSGQPWACCKTHSIIRIDYACSSQRSHHHIGKSCDVMMRCTNSYVWFRSLISCIWPQFACTWLTWDEYKFYVILWTRLWHASNVTCIKCSYLIRDDIHTRSLSPNANFDCIRLLMHCFSWVGTVTKYFPVSSIHIIYNQCITPAIKSTDSSLIWL